MNSLEVSKHDSETLLNPEMATPPSLTHEARKSSGPNIKNITAELEKRRAELFTLVRAAEARTREAEEKCREVETRLEQEIDQRRLAELRLQEAENRLKEVEGRMKEAETWVKEEAEARKLAENALLEAEDEARAATLALAKAEQQKAEAETKSEEVRIKLEQEMSACALAEQRFREIEGRYLREQQAREIEELKHYTAATARAEIEDRLKEAESRLKEAEANLKKEADARTRAESVLIEAEAGMQAAEENTRKMEALYFNAEALAQELSQKHQTAEARLQDESKQRILAEQKLKAIEDELCAYLEDDWSKSEPDITQAGTAGNKVETDELVSSLQAQIEAEQQARREAEDARAAAEIKAMRMEETLRKTEEAHRQQEEEFSAWPEQIALARRVVRSFSLLEPTGEEFPHAMEEVSLDSAIEQKVFRVKLKFIGYGVVITSLLFAAGWLITSALHQI